MARKGKKKHQQPRSLTKAERKVKNLNIINAASDELLAKVFREYLNSPMGPNRDRVTQRIVWNLEREEEEE